MRYRRDQGQPTEVYPTLRLVRPEVGTFAFTSLLAAYAEFPYAGKGAGYVKLAL